VQDFFRQRVVNVWNNLPVNKLISLLLLVASNNQYKV